DRAMYNIAGVDFNMKWDKFYVQRDYEKEKYVMNEVYGISLDEKYIFIHDDKKRGYRINFKSDMPVIRPVVEFGVFDFLSIIENAFQVHCMDSCFLNMIDCMGLKNDNLFFHKYIRIQQNTENGTPVLKQNWEVIK
ncbi:MAG: hypothetical protein ACOCWM_06325, partial [Cyclobacteriaceae bacterium]